MVWISLLVLRSRTRTFEFSSAVANSRLPATSAVKWSKSPSLSSGNGIVCKGSRTGFCWAHAPATSAKNTADKIITRDLFTFTSSIEKQDRCHRTTRHRKLMNCATHINQDEHEMRIKRTLKTIRALDLRDHAKQCPKPRAGVRRQPRASAYPT